MMGTWTKPHHWLIYPFISYPPSLLRYFAVNPSDPTVRVTLTVNVPVLLHIDPRGHFTGLRCAAIACLDRLAVRAGEECRMLLINLCEFLANYPTF